MAYPATDVRIEAGPFGLFAERRHPDARLKDRRERPADRTSQMHEFTGVGPVDGWHRAGPAKRRLPGRADQAAFFPFAAAIIVAKEIFTFRTSLGFHVFKFPMIFLNDRNYH